tara:strand:- start:2890 stop:3129 length:240 start_codon:yes stop_codon:yes gene_type:complete
LAKLLARVVSINLKIKIMFYQDDYQRVSMILNDTKAYEKIAKALNIEQVDNDSEIFHDIEEFIVDKFREMKEKYSDEQH